MQINNPSRNTINYTGLAKYQTIVDEKLIRGRAITCPYRLYQMKKEGITQIIDLRNTSILKRPIEKFFCKLLNIKYENRRYPYRINTLPNKEFFISINNSIVNNNGKTYIHCQHGKRRTGICTAIYEKNHTTKTKDEIITNMIKMGYTELLTSKKSRKITKLKTIYNNFIKNYFPEDISNI